MGYILGIVFIFFYYSTFIYTVIKTCTTRKKHFAKKEIARFCITTFALISLVAIIMAAEKYVYFWDFGAYWYKTLDYEKCLMENSGNALQTLYYSINNEEYNYLACMIISIPLHLTGDSYYSFVVLNTCMFYVPNAILLAHCIDIISNESSINKIHSYNNIYIYTITFTIFLFPVLNGYVDIIATLQLTVAFALIIQRDFSRIDPVEDIMLGFAILWVVLLRRYFAYSVLGLFAFTVIFWMTKAIQENKTEYGKNSSIKVMAADSFLTLLVPSVILLLGFKDFLVMSIFNNHADAYSAYKTTNILGEFALLARYIGLLFAVLLLIGIVLNLRNGIKSITISLLTWLIVTCLLFFRIQNMGLHHYYTIAIQICILIFMGYDGLIKMIKVKSGWGGRTVCFAIVLVCSCNFISSFSNILRTQILSPLFIENVYIPKIRRDIDELNDLEKYLGELNCMGYENVYVVGSSGVINSDILRKLNAPNFDLPFNLFNTSDVDLRDGFNCEFFDADIVIACQPEQCHLTHGQHVITDLNTIMTGTNIYSDNYTLIKRFVVEDNVTLLVYVKKQDLGKEDINFVENIFDQIYPNEAAMFHDRFEKYMQEMNYE